MIGCRIMACPTVHRVGMVLVHLVVVGTRKR